MKPKRPLLALAVLIAAGGVWLASRDRFRAQPTESSVVPSGAVSNSSKTPGPDGHEQQLRPPDPDRKFRELTPEQRVKLARRGPIGG